MKSETILKQLRDRRKEMRTLFSVRRIALFGSSLRDDKNQARDIDLLVELEEPSFDHYMDLKFYLESLFEKPVDLVLADSIKARIKPVILREAVYA